MRGRDDMRSIDVGGNGHVAISQVVRQDENYVWFGSNGISSDDDER